MNFTCTFTGVDSNTIRNNTPGIIDLSHRYPFIEWGVLFSLSRPGKDLKYPWVEEIKEFADNLHDAIHNDKTLFVKRSIHLCGSAARKFLTIESSADSTFINDVVGRFDRIQLNINAKELEFEIKPTILRQLGIFYRPIILQYNDNNKEFLEAFDLQKYANIHILKDASGGNGVFSSDVTIPEICRHSTIGFAGGFGPENIELIFPNIYESVMSNNVDGQFENTHFSIDMESKVRNEYNQFDLDKVERVAKYLDTYLKDKSIEF